MARRLLIIAAALAVTLGFCAQVAAAGGYSSYRSSSFSSSSTRSSYSRPSSSSYRAPSSSPSRSSVPTVKAPGGGYAPRVKVPTTISRYPVRPTAGRYVHVYDVGSHLWVWILYAQAQQHGWAPQSNGGVGGAVAWVFAVVVLFAGLIAATYYARGWWVRKVTV